jgi:hypothetical protein
VRFNGKRFLSAYKRCGQPCLAPLSQSGVVEAEQTVAFAF